MAADFGKTKTGLYAIAAGVGVSVAVLIASNISFLISVRDQTHAASVRALQNLSLSIERSISSEIAERKEDLAGIVQLLETSKSASEDILGVFARTIPSFTVLDAHGQPRVSDVWGPKASELPDGDYSQEPFFKILENELGSDILVTAGADARVPSAALILSRRMQTGSGAFDGVVVKTVGLGRLTEVLKRFDLGDGGFVTILTEDGRLLATDRPRLVPGLDLSRSEPYRHVAEHGFGSFDAVSLLDGRSRVYVTRKIPEASLLLFVGTSLETVYAPFRTVAEVEVAAALVLALLIAGFAVAARHELRLRRLSETAAKLAALSARRSEGLVTTYFENLAHGVLGIRVQPGGGFRIERVNANVQRLLGVPDCLLGRDPHDVFAGGILPDFVHQLQHCLETKRPSQRTVPLSTTGRVQALRVTLTPVLDEADGPVGLILASLEDVTFHEIAQAKLLQTHRMNGIERITSGVANEFNNLLQSMMGHLEMLAEEIEGQDAAEAHAKSALDAAARGTRLTQGLLSSSSQQLLQPEPVLPERKLARMAQSFEAKRNPRIHLVTSVEPGTPPVRADASHLQAALLNICENAQEAMLPAGGTITVRAYGRDATSPGGSEGTSRLVVFSVTDDGGGMTPDVMARAREPFFTTKGERFRSGLGLSMADGFARQSGGELSLESSPGKGTTVELSLPAAEPQTVDDDLAPLSRPLRVLVVDDAADQLGMLEELLRDEGCQVTALADSRQAAAMLRGDSRFDILITDYIMPGANGMDLIEDAFKQQPGIMALLITGTPNVPVQTGAPGSLSVLRKPFRADQLLRQVRRMARTAEHDTLIG